MLGGQHAPHRVLRARGQQLVVVLLAVVGVLGHQVTITRALAFSATFYDQIPAVRLRVMRSARGVLSLLRVVLGAWNRKLTISCFIFIFVLVSHRKRA